MCDRIGLGALLAVFIAAGSMSGCAKCPPTCLPPHVFFHVSPSPNGGVLSGVEVAYSGPTSGYMTCEGGSGVCEWPGSGQLMNGTYIFQASAEGYRSAAIEVKVTFSTDPDCHCISADLRPSQVVLDPL